MELSAFDEPSGIELSAEMLSRVAVSNQSNFGMIDC